MSTPTPSPLRRFIGALAITALLPCALVTRAHAVADNALTQHIWKLKYGVSDAQLSQQSPHAGWLDQDADGDGIKNKDECAAGTNPFNPGSVVRITSITPSGANDVNITFPTQNGKQYVVEGTSAMTIGFTLTGVSWDESTNTGSKMLTVAKGANKFFRVLVRDMDTDNDGVGDWAEKAVTLTHTTATTVPGVNDYDYVRGQVYSDINTLTPRPNLVTIKAATPFASEDGPTAGSMTIERTMDLFPTTVTYGVSGTASAGVDYQPLGGSVIFPARGPMSQALPVNPMTQATVKGSRSVTAALNGPGGGDFPFTLGSPNAATVIINPSTFSTGTGLLARYYDNASGTYDHAANFGDSGNYSNTRAGTSPNFTGTVVVTPTGISTTRLADLLAAITPGTTQVKLSFNGGNLNTGTYNHQSYLVASKTTTTFTCTLPPGAGLPAASSNTCGFSIQPLHPPVIERVDMTVNNDWIYGTPNAVGIAAAAGTIPTNVPDNFSETFETYLSPATAGSYRFQLDADDKARVLLDLNGNGTFELPGEQIVEHGWDTSSTGSPEDGVADNETVGTFKISTGYTLAVPGSPAARYRMRVEHVETTGEARCRLQWSRDGGNFGNIPQAEQFTHTQAITYAFTRAASPVTTGTATISLAGHGLSGGNSVVLAFSNGTLFTPNTIDPNGYSGTYTVATVPDANSFTVTLNSTGSTLPVNQGAGATGFLENRTASTTTGVFNKIYTNTTFTNAPGRIGTNGHVTEQNNGLWGTGTPDAVLINPDTFSVRWSGQVQPQFTEEYTFIVHADDGSSLRINGQLQEMKTVPSTSTGIGTYTYDSGTGNVVVTYTNGVVKPDSFVAGEPVRVDFTSGTLTHGNGSTYTYDGATGVLTVDYSNLTNITPGGFNAGDVIELDPTAGTLTTLSTLPYTVLPAPAPTATTFAVYVQPGLFDSQPTAATINVLDTRNTTVAAVSTVGTSPNTFTFNIGTGKYSAGGGNINVEIVNKPLKEWSSMGNERYCRIPMVGGTRYDIQLDYWENTGNARCILYWYSPNQPKQVIPKERLYPSNLAADLIAKAAHISPTQATALVGGFFSLPVAGSNGASVTVSGNPAWLTYSGGVLSGTPPTGAAGDYQILLTITNAAGTSTSVVNLHVDAAGGEIARDYWNAVYANLALIPTSTTPSGTENLMTSLAKQNAGDDFGARIRGYITAPTTGNYYFWIASSSASELWISNDDEPINAFKRAWVTTGNATPETWGAEANQKSAWLALEQGRKYYVEILYKASAGADNVAVGWLKPGQNGTAPSEVVPGYVLSPYTPPAAGSTPGTLYIATMLSQDGATTNGVGSATFRLSEDENSALITFTYRGLSNTAMTPIYGTLTDWHIHNDPYLNIPSDIRYDPNMLPANSGPQPDHNPPSFYSHKWTFPPTMGSMTKAQFIELLKQGKAYINLHTAAYPAGEIRGNLTLANGTRTFTPPPAPLTWTDDSGTDAGAARFLTQATYGANIADINALNGLAATGGGTYPGPNGGTYPASRYETWINNQFAQAPSSSSLHLAEVIRTENASVQGGAWNEELFMNAWWWKAMTGPDQLRQRVAFALSEIHVISGQGPLDNEARALAYFYDRLVQGIETSPGSGTYVGGAFGNFRDILEFTTLTPGMGRYLDMLNNDKPDQTVGRIPNENYAREIKQLFSVGLFRMWPDGSLMLTSKDAPIDTYKQPEIIGFAHVFTGWTNGYDGAYRTSLNAPTNWMRQMREVPARHYTGPKRILNNEVLPGIPNVGGQALDPIATHTANIYQSTTYEGLPALELDAAHDQLFNHPNTGPFICRQLIQRLVTSHPSRDYLYRVVQKFNDNGSGVRGDMKAVIKAILLDYEARHPNLIDDPGFGKQRESLLRVTAAGRAFRTTAWTGTYSQTGSRTITVTTATPHKLQATNDGVFLDFTTGSPAPWIGAYTANVTGTNTFTVTAQGWSALVNYSIPTNSTTCTVTYGGHWLATGNQIYADFLSVSAGTLPADGIYTVAGPGTATDYPTPTAGTTFTIQVPAQVGARTGTLVFPRFTPGSYSVAASGITSPAGQERRITMDTNINHELLVGDQVQLNFFNAANIANLPADYVATVESVVDLNTWTFLAPSASFPAIHSYDAVYQFPLKLLPMTRNGNLGSRPSTFVLNNTTGELEMAPMYSPTVFNFYLPDYKFPGALASAGVTTPEFQTTAETTAIRQANFLYNGVFGMDNTNGLSSFNNGNAALVLDFSPWYANATTDGFGAGPQTGQAWTSNANLPTLIEHMNTLLVSGQLSTSAKNRILKFLFGSSNIATPPISSISPAGTASPITITTAEAHGLNTGDSITIQGVTGTFTAINGTFTVTRTGPTDGTSTTFTIPIARGAGTTATLTAAHFSPVAYTNSGAGFPTDTQKRDRLRAIIHLILTSPDFTIQR